MIVEVDGISYETQYFPFFRKEKRKDCTIYGLRYPSGNIEDFCVYDGVSYMNEFRVQLKFLIKEYLLEDDDMLTSSAKDLKKDVGKLFGQDIEYEA